MKQKGHYYDELSCKVRTYVQKNLNREHIISQALIACKIKNWYTMFSKIFGEIFSVSSVNEISIVEQIEMPESLDFNLFA